MTSQRELIGLLDAFFVEGTTELADRVIDGALDQIDHIHQRRAMRVPWRLQTMPMLSRLAAAAVIGVLAIGGALYLSRLSQTGASSPSPTAVQSLRPSQPAPIATPQASPAGPLGVGRQLHTATRLTDGRVLVAGGYAPGDVPLADAALYDPGTDTFSPTGSLGTARGLHTATLLVDGRVLITGGGPVNWVDNVGPYTDSAELYDPATGTFSPTGRMTTTREDHTATLLLDGRVLITGGNDVTSHGIASAELYDPATGTFSPTGKMMDPRGFHAATLLLDGRVLITGGRARAWTDAGEFITSAELYDPTTGTFTATGPMLGPRAHHDAVLLADGRVLITGGWASGGDYLATAELFDPTAGTFTATGLMAEARTFHSATVLADGRVLVAGGEPTGTTTYGPFLASAELYDPATGTFTPTGPMSEARSYQGATLLTDGRVLMTAGYGNLAPLATAEIYDPATGTFGPAG